MVQLLILFFTASCQNNTDKTKIIISLYLMCLPNDGRDRPRLRNINTTFFLLYHSASERHHDWRQNVGGGREACEFLFSCWNPTVPERDYFLFKMVSSANYLRSNEILIRIVDLSLSPANLAWGTYCRQASRNRFSIVTEKFRHPRMILWWIRGRSEALRWRGPKHKSPFLLINPSRRFGSMTSLMCRVSSKWIMDSKKFGLG